MSVYCQQLIDGDAIDPEWLIDADAHPDLDNDMALLQRKAASAANGDWDIEWLSDTSFVARKVRWNPDSLCERIFRVGP
jgi:hypothetical protein